MAEFRFKAYSKSGEVVTESIRADTQAEAIRQLSARGLIAFEIGASRSSRRRGPRLPLRTLASFCRQMATMTESDLPIDEALGLLATDTDKRSASLATELRKAVLGGQTLSGALSSHTSNIPDFMIGLVSAGETGGALGPVFSRLADGFEDQIRLVETIRSALIYPIVLCVTALASLVLVLTVVAPALAPVFASAGDKAPLSARMLITASDLLRNYWWAGLIAILGAFLVISAALRSPPGRKALDRMALGAPLVGQVAANTEAARFLYSLSALLENGVSVVNALVIARGGASNSVVASDIDRIAGRVREGDRLGVALSQSRVFPSLAGQMASVGERTGGLEKMLRHAAKVLEETAQRRVKQLMAAATPILTLVLGVLVGGVVLSLLSAIMSVNDLAL